MSMFVTCHRHCDEGHYCSECYNELLEEEKLDNINFDDDQDNESDTISYESNSDEDEDDISVEELNNIEIERKHKLVKSLNEAGLQFRNDSKLCKNYVKGKLDNTWTYSEHCK